VTGVKCDLDLTKKK